MKNFVKIILIFVISFISLFVIAPKAQAYSNNNMIHNAVFDSKNSMSEQDIRNFINSRPNTCLTRVGANLGGGNIYPRPVSYFSYGPTMTDAAGVIYEAAQYNDINPRVILATLQKEQSLLTDNDCYDPQGFASLPKAMGYGCFEGPGAACPPAAYAGFHQQVMKGAWQLAFDRNRAEGNVSWGGNDNIVYGGRMTQGIRKRCGSCSAIYYDGYSVIDGQNIYIQNGGTAALFNYTPHLNQSFPGIYTSFFGSDPSALPNPYHSASVFRMYFPWNGRHFYTSSYTETLDIVARGAKFEGVAFLAPNYPGSVPAYRFWLPSLSKHFYTTSEVERSYVQNILRFNYEGISFYTQPTQVPTTMPIYRLWQPSSGDHLYTTSAAERDGATRVGYIYEGIAFYAY